LTTSSKAALSFLPAAGWSGASTSADREMRTVSCLTSEDALACSVSSGARLAAASVAAAGAWVCAWASGAALRAATVAHAAPSLVSEKTGCLNMDWS